MAGPGSGSRYFSLFLAFQCPRVKRSFLAIFFCIHLDRHNDWRFSNNKKGKGKAKEMQCKALLLMIRQKTAELRRVACIVLGLRLLDCLSVPVALFGMVGATPQFW